MDLKEKLEKAGQLAQEQKAERRARVVKGSHLINDINSLVTASGLKTKENTGFVVVFGAGSSKLCVAKRGGRVDLSGFSLEHPAVVAISAEDAKKEHLGKVRGHVDFDKGDADVLSAVSAALAYLAAETPKDVRPRRVKAAPAEVPAVDAAETKEQQ